MRLTHYEILRNRLGRTGPHHQSELLALILHRAQKVTTTMDFNDNVEDMALDRVNNPANPAWPDKIVIVDMEAGADIDYHLSTDNPPGDMWDDLHPSETGYAKMADLWFDSLIANPAPGGCRPGSECR